MRRAVSRIMPSRQSRNNKASNTSSISPQSSASSIFNGNFKIDLNSVAEFYITLDNPHKSWLPGDEVSGQIILISRKNLANISISLSLVGCVKINASSHSKLRPVKHNLFNHTITIYGDETNDDYGDPEFGRNSSEFKNGLFKGEHRFPFIVKLPNKRIFTSIDFGKGSIIYLLKATIRNLSNNAGSASNNSSPNNINLDITSSNSTNNSNTSNGNKFIAKAKSLKLLNNNSFTCEKLIQLVNPIDVAKLPPPNSKRLIIKPPNSKKLSRSVSSTSTINTFGTVSSNNSDNYGEAVAMHSEGTPSSLVTNHVTNNSSSTPNNNSTTSNSPGIGQNVIVSPAATPPKSESSNAPTPSNQTRETIKVSLDIPARGYLRGELIPIKLNVSHLKLIQDLNGIIVTFVRVCRLDNGPASLYESFRKDLYQQILPLYVDPVTLKAETSTSVRVPADAFPTISGCPLVSFQYFIEVLINLSGKSIPLDAGDHGSTGASKDSLFAASGGAGSGSFNFNFSPGESFNSKERSSYINTDKYKRMKKFIQLTSEIIIGTHRSEISITRQSNEDAESTSPLSVRSSTVGSAHSGINDSVPPGGQSVNSPISHRSTGDNSRTINDNVAANATRVTIPSYSDSGQEAPEYVESNNESTIPVPNLFNLSEKDQMNLRVQSLMPSAPPLDGIEEDINGVSPVENSDDILQHLPDTETEQDQTEEVALSTNHQNATPYDFFSYNTQDNISTLENDNEIDFVPNYNSIVNNTLVNHTVAQEEQEQTSNTSLTTFQTRS